MTEIVGRIAPGSNRIALAVDAGQWAERGVLGENLASVVRVEHDLEVVVSHEAPGGIVGLE